MCLDVTASTWLLWGLRPALFDIINHTNRMTDNFTQKYYSVKLLQLLLYNVGM